MNENPSPFFLLAFGTLVLLLAPLWAPLAMLASIASGKSLKDYNEEANKL